MAIPSTSHGNHLCWNSGSLALKCSANFGLPSLTVYRVAPTAPGRTDASVTIHSVSSGLGIVKVLLSFRASCADLKALDRDSDHSMACLPDSAPAIAFSSGARRAA